MPGMDGFATYKKLKAINPRIKIIFMSGFPDQELLKIDKLSNFCTFLKKPFSIKEVGEKVKEMVN
jgi:DNA-binding response OmpR family regulator